ncbi:MAG TPA: lysozyme inhibitor LprI family protein [Candidatus Methylomirabilis sp.]|nr:lysozyme inhibitor LprI family protein [Candidatus Methylomirabilis sp.]
MPAQDRPSPEEEKALAQCVSVDLYFGFGQPADPVKARKCAYVEMEKGDEGLAFGGGTILMMVYANGKGAARNFDVALKLGCERGGEPGDVAGNVHQLSRLKQAHWTGSNFSVCDHSSGRYLYAQCAILQDRFDTAERDTNLNAIVAKWGAQDSIAFQALRQAANRFFTAHAGKESDLEGTLEVHERAFLENGFIATLEQLERGELPEFSADDFRQADAAMKAAYTRIQTGTTRRWGTVTPEGIKTGQEAWIPYRDTWVSFGKIKYPGVSAEAWKTLLTQQRIAMLEFFLH